MLDNALGEVLKHRRVLLKELDNPNEDVITAIKEELEKTDVLAVEIRQIIADIRTKLLG